MNIAIASHDTLVSQFQLSAAGARPWSETLRDVSTGLRASAASLSVLDSAMGMAAVQVYGYTPAQAAAFCAGEARAKGWATMLAAAPAGQVYFNRTAPSPEADPWLGESLAALGVRYYFGIKLRLPGSGAAAMTCVRPESDGPAEDDTLATLQRLAPDIERALALGVLIERETVTRLALLEALSLKADGIVLLDSGGHIAFTNDAAEAIFRRGDGLFYHGGELCAQRLPETRRLHRMIADAGSSVRMLVSRRSGARPYVVHCLPVPGSERFLTVQSIARVIHIHDLGSEQGTSREALMAIFGLTDREAELASALSRRGQLGQAASESEMAYNTARNHLQSIFRKTGTTNQVEVAQLLARLP